MHWDDKKGCPIPNIFHFSQSRFPPPNYTMKSFPQACKQDNSKRYLPHISRLMAIYNITLPSCHSSTESFFTALESSLSWFFFLWTVDFFCLNSCRSHSRSHNQGSSLYLHQTRHNIRDYFADLKKKTFIGRYLSSCLIYTWKQREERLMKCS